MLSEELPTPNATLAPLRSAQHTLPSPANRAMRGGDELADCHSERSEESLADLSPPTANLSTKGKYLNEN